MEAVTIIPQEEFKAIRQQIDRIESAQAKVFSQANANEFFTPEEAAKILKISTKTLSNWRERNLIEFFQVGANIRFTKAQIQNFIEKNSLKSK